MFHDHTRYIQNKLEEDSGRNSNLVLSLEEDRPRHLPLVCVVQTVTPAYEESPLPVHLKFQNTFNSTQEAISLGIIQILEEHFNVILYRCVFNAITCFLLF